MSNPLQILFCEPNGALWLTLKRNHTTLKPQKPKSRMRKNWKLTKRRTRTNNLNQRATSEDWSRRFAKSKYHLFFSLPWCCNKWWKWFENSASILFDLQKVVKRCLVDFLYFEIQHWLQEEKPYQFSIGSKCSKEGAKCILFIRRFRSSCSFEKE